MMGMTGIGFTPFNWFIHVFFLIVFLVGLVLFIVWAVRTIKKDKLLPWAIGLLILGILGGSFTMQWGMMNSWNNVNWQNMAQHMRDEDHSDLTAPEEWQEHMLEEMSEYM